MAASSRPPSRVGPFLKWAGGKGQLLAQFQHFLPKSLAGRGYVEPFMGSGAVFFEVIQTRNPARCTLLDANPDLVNLFVQVRDRVEELLPLLSEHRQQHNRPGISEADRKSYYYTVRASTPAPDSVEAAARFLYLNKTCFNGLHRLNSKGLFNVPMGSYTHPKIFDPEHLRSASVLLQKVRLETSSFRSCEKYIDEGDFVYLDPPYEPLSPTSSFTAYAKDAFSLEDQTALRDLLVRMAPRCQWMMSNSTAASIERLYDQPGLHKFYVSAARSINSSGAGRGKIPELVITNYPVDPIIPPT
jgi:DNA adenine methylase